MSFKIIRAARHLSNNWRCLAARPSSGSVINKRNAIIDATLPLRHISNTRLASSLSPETSSMAPSVLFEPSSLPTTKLSNQPIQSWEGDLAVIAVTEDDFLIDGETIGIQSESLKCLDADFGSAISAIVSEGGFEGKQGSQSKAVRVGAAPSKAKYVALVGLGKASGAISTVEWGPSPFLALGGAVAGVAKANKSKTVAVGFALPPSAEVSAIIQQVFTGALLGGYESVRFKSKKSTSSRLESIHLILPGAASDPMGEMIRKAHATARGALMTRYLVEAPPNICTPSHLADAAQHIAQSFPTTISLKVLEKDECQVLGMGSFLGVAEASDEPPKFIHLTYRPEGTKANKVVALVGKGLTFDSGGYNIKAGPGSMIEMMKFDMGGAAATLGAARIIAEVAPLGVEVHFLVAACENMVSGRGMRPGDILTAASGKTIEVNNTDAEGRLTLADALWYAQEKCGATSVVDSATLTGACIVALGPDIAGLFTPSDKMAESLIRASRASGEKIWRMPMESGYWESMKVRSRAGGCRLSRGVYSGCGLFHTCQMKSPVADMKNSGGRWGGSITAALFLKQFVKDEVDWAHLDIAGPVWDEKAGLPTGFGATTLAEWAIGQANN